MKSVLLLAFALISIQLTFLGQSEPVLELNHFEIEKRYDPAILNYFQDDNGNFYILKTEPIKGPGGWSYYIEKRDPQMTKISVRDITADLDLKNYTIEEYILLDGNLMILSSKIDKKNHEEIFYQQNIDLSTLQFSERLEFYKTQYNKKNKRPIFLFDVSNNKEYFLITIIPPYNKDNEEKVSMYLMDNQLNSIWKREDFSLEVKDKDYTINKIFVGDNGKVYMTGKNTSGEKENDHEIFVFTESDINNVKFDFEENDIQRIGIGLNHNNELIVTSYFTNKETKGIKGILYNIFDADNLNLITKVQENFSEDLILFGRSPKYAEKEQEKSDKKGFEIGASNLRVNDILTSSTGDTYIIGQSYRIVQRTYRDSRGNAYTREVYCYGDIYVSKFSDKHQLTYNSKIPFYTESFMPQKHFAWILKNNQLSFMFMDDTRNQFENFIANEGVVRVGSVKNSVFAYVTIDDDGTAERKILYDYNKNLEKDFRMFGYYNNISTAIILVYKGRKVFNIGLIK